MSWSKREIVEKKGTQKEKIECSIEAMRKHNEETIDEKMILSWLRESASHVCAITPKWLVTIIVEISWNDL